MLQFCLTIFRFGSWERWTDLNSVDNKLSLIICSTYMVWRCSFYFCKPWVYSERIEYNSNCSKKACKYHSMLMYCSVNLISICSAKTTTRSFSHKRAIVSSIEPIISLWYVTNIVWVRIWNLVGDVRGLKTIMMFLPCIVMIAQWRNNHDLIESVEYSLIAIRVLFSFSKSLPNENRSNTHWKSTITFSTNEVFTRCMIFTVSIAARDIVVNFQQSNISTKWKQHNHWCIRRTIYEIVCSAYILQYLARDWSLIHDFWLLYHKNGLFHDCQVVLIRFESEISLIPLQFSCLYSILALTSQLNFQSFH